jgi:sodium transport system permease protein
LLARGLDPAIASGVQVALVDVSQSAGPGAFERAEAPLIVLAIVLTFGLTSGSLAVQLIAGERERRTMEPLLNEATRREALALGKTGAAFAFGVVSSGVILVGLAVLVGFLPFGSVLGAPSPLTVLSSFLGMVLIGLTVVVLQMVVVAAFAGSADAASNRNMLLTLLVTGVAVLTVAGAPYGTALHAVPIISALALTGEILLGQPAGIAAVAMTLLSSIAAILFGLWLVARLFGREAIARS